MSKYSARKQTLDADALRSRLKLKSLQAQNLLAAHHAPVVKLLENAGIRPGSLRLHAAKLLTAGAAASSLVFSLPSSSPAKAGLPPSSIDLSISPVDFRSSAKNLLAQILPGQPGNLPEVLEHQVTRVIHQTYGIHAVAELEGNRLNTDYGFIGAEQHLPRFPGDTISQHDGFQSAGITPGRGAWGYFAPSRNLLTPDLVTKEKWYVAVQTLYLPDWQVRLAYLRDWYKYRKVVVLNPSSGRAVVAVVADSGPAAFTGKHFGGSPEVMDALKSKDGRQKGPVVLFFVDDPQNQVPLGPLEYNLEAGPPLLTSI